MVEFFFVTTSLFMTLIIHTVENCVCTYILYQKRDYFMFQYLPNFWNVKTQTDSLFSMAWSVLT